MTVRLLDTNIVSYLMNGHSLASRYQPHLIGHTLAISFMTVAELWDGAISANWGARRQTGLQAMIAGMLVLHSDADTCKRRAEVHAARRGQPISSADAWIAATALVNGLELVTHDAADFRGIPGLTIITEAP